MHGKDIYCQGLLCVKWIFSRQGSIHKHIMQQLYSINITLIGRNMYPLSSDTNLKRKQYGFDKTLSLLLRLYIVIQAKTSLWCSTPQNPSAVRIGQQMKWHCLLSLSSITPCTNNVTWLNKKRQLEEWVCHKWQSQKKNKLPEKLKRVFESIGFEHSAKHTVG
jgi:hypothetical protein